jgi:hypothetical protein
MWRSTVGHAMGRGHMKDFAGEPFYRSPDGRTRLYGQAWEQAPLTRIAILACWLGKHQAVMWGWLDDRYEERCACGARRGDEGEWTGGGRFRRGAVPTPDEINLDEAVEDARMRNRQRFSDWFRPGGGGGWGDGGAG